MKNIIIIVLTVIAVSSISFNIKLDMDLGKLNLKHKGEMSKLKKKNKTLRNQRAKTRKAISRNKSRFAKNGLKRVGKKLARAGAAMVPVAGMAIVAASTADEIHDICQDIESAVQLEVELFEQQSNVPTPEKDYYCNEQIGKELAQLASQYSTEMKKDLEQMRSSLQRKSLKLVESSMQISDGITNADYAGEAKSQYNSIIRFWSLQIESAATPSSTPSVIERTSEYWGQKAYDALN